MKKLSFIAMLLILFLSARLAAQTAIAPSAGDGTQSNPYQISSLENLFWIKQNTSSWTSYFVQTADIDASPTTNWNQGAGWEPIGSYNSRFKGNYNGKNHVIDGLYINRPTTNIQALFGYNEAATIDSLGLTNAYVKGAMQVAALCANQTGLYIAATGSFIESKIRNCYATGMVTSGSQNVGGLVANSSNYALISNSFFIGDVNGSTYVGGLCSNNSSNSTITNCFTAGTVTGTSQSIGGLVGYNEMAYVYYSYSNCTVSGGTTGKYVGGLVGMNNHTIATLIDKCYATGNVSGNELVGGLVGNNLYGAINNSYATGNATAVKYAGGLIGWNSTDNNTKVMNCYSLGSATASQSYYKGGLIGYRTYAYQEVTNCFWNIETSGCESSYGGTGKTSMEMKNIANYISTTTAGLASAWDFTGTVNNDIATEDIWSISESLNNGYPYFNWQSFPIAPVVSSSAISNIGATSAVVSGNITSIGSPAVFQHGICWNTTGSPSISDNFTQEGVSISTGEFQSTITNLTPGTQYFVKAYAKNGAGVVYGDELSFTTKRAVTIGGSFVAANKVYDGTNAAEITSTNLSLTGLAEGHNVSLSNFNAVFTQINAGQNIAVNLTTAQLTGPDSDLYVLSLSGAPSATANITKKTLGFTATFTIADKTYDGTTNATPNSGGLELNGVVGTDYLTINNLAFNFAQANAGSNIPVHATGEVSGLAIENYEYSFDSIAPVYANILTKGANISGNFTATNKVYDGTDSASIETNNLIVNGLIGSDTVNLSNVVVKFAEPTVGNNVAVNIQSALLEGPQSGNYSLVFENAPSSQANIVAKTLTISGSFTVSDKTFDNTTVAEIEQNNLVLVGAIEDDEVSLTSISVVFNQVDAGNDIPVFISSAEITGNDAFNYNLSLDNAPSSTGNIFPPQIFELTISIVGSGSVNVDGSPYTSVMQVVEGTTINLLAIPETNWAFSSWTGDLNSTQNFESVLVNSDINLTATFVDLSTPQFTLTLNITGNGTVNVNGQSYASPVTVFEGTVLNLEAIATTDWHFASWSGDLVSVATIESLTMNANKTIDVLFEEGNNIEEFGKANFDIFPNPFATAFSINNHAEIERLKISNISGQTILDMEKPGQWIETSFMNSGVYFMQYTSINGTIYTQKIIKQ